MTYTTEITSDKLASDNPIHQRLLKAYYAAKPYLAGKLLEIGCGEGRGISILEKEVSEYIALDRHQPIINRLKAQYPDVKFLHKIVPPFDGMSDNEFDVVIAFQVIEHIKNDQLFLKEIHRILKKGGKAVITTPNIKKTLTRNPWHIREYTANQLYDLAYPIFDQIEQKGITGNEKVMQYYDMNKKAVEKITRFDVLNLQYRLPASLLRIPYDILNRLNRNRLKSSDNTLVNTISHTDYLVSEDPDSSLDLFYIMRK